MPGEGQVLGTRETERAILDVKELFQRQLASELNLTRVSAPLLVLSGSGINDDLDGIQKPLSFEAPGLGGRRVEIVQSLAKWKRLALAEYGFAPGEGIYTDMNAIRPDETPGEMHSLYVDQWDWERVITAQERTLEHLVATARAVYRAVRGVEGDLAERYPALGCRLADDLTVIHAAELERRHGALGRKEREDAACEEHGAVLLVGIGAPLADGRPHDSRAPDYDDWSTPTELGPGLNGDILVWNEVLGRAYELSSMGIRVDAGSLRAQLEATGAMARAELPFHRRLLDGGLPLTVGGGIGQSRLCMLYLRKRHIGEVQCGVWPEGTRSRMAREGAPLL
jgi:aspartate--ammonia ligase